MVHPSIHTPPAPPAPFYPFCFAKNSSAVFVPLDKLHRGQVRHILLTSFDPPRESGCIWSIWNFAFLRSQQARMLVRLGDVEWIKLGQLGDRQAIVPLIELLKDSDDYYRRNSALSSKLFYAKTNDNTFAADARAWKLLAHYDENVRETVAWLLGQVKNPDTIPLIAAYLEHPFVNVQRAAAQALYAMDLPEARAPFDGWRQKYPTLIFKPLERLDEND